MRGVYHFKATRGSTGSEILCPLLNQPGKGEVIVHVS